MSGASNAALEKAVDNGALERPNVPGLPTNLYALRRLGKGSYGSVYLCEDRDTGVRCAVKQIKDASHGKSTLREFMLLAQLRHENLVHLLDFAPVLQPNFSDVLLVLPYMPADLRKVIRSGQLTGSHIEAVTSQILRGLACLHAAGVAHRDLKPANVLVDSNVQVKICDFGLARGDMDEACEGAPALTEYIVTRWYRAPEVMLLPGMYTPAIDLWSVGCILFEMLHRKPLFPGKNHLDMVRRFADICGRPSSEDSAWVPADSKALLFLQRCCGAAGEPHLAVLLASAPPAAADLVRRLLSWNPANRPSASDAQEHPYLLHLVPASPPVAASRFDWSFDKGRKSSERMRRQLYFECARLHPEILKRDQKALHDMGWKVPEEIPRPAAQHAFEVPLAVVAAEEPPQRSRRPRQQVSATCSTRQSVGEMPAPSARGGTVRGQRVARLRGGMGGVEKAPGRAARKSAPSLSQFSERVAGKLATRRRPGECSDDEGIGDVSPERLGGIASGVGVGTSATTVCVGAVSASASAACGARTFAVRRNSSVIFPKC